MHGAADGTSLQALEGPCSVKYYFKQYKYSSRDVLVAMVALGATPVGHIELNPAMAASATAQACVANFNVNFTGWPLRTFREL